MRLSVATTLAAFCASVQAFTDTSPFLLFSTSKFSVEPSKAQLQTNGQVSSSARHILSSCPSSRYLLVSQPNLNAAHLRSGEGAPKLRQAWHSDEVQGRYSVAEVAGDVDPKELAEYIKNVCREKSTFIDEIDLDAIPASATSWTVRKNDNYLGVVLNQYEVEGDYTVIYAAGSRSEVPAGEAGHYEPEFHDSAHIELKRQVQQFGRRSINTTTNLPLFEKYQFFTPGIFMSLVALLVLVSILGVGIKALASLEVSYGAFDKEMGPSAQRKQQ